MTLEERALQIILTAWIYKFTRKSDPGVPDIVEYYLDGNFKIDLARYKHRKGDRHGPAWLKASHPT